MQVRLPPGGVALYVCLSVLACGLAHADAGSGDSTVGQDGALDCPEMCKCRSTDSSGAQRVLCVGQLRRAVPKDLPPQVASLDLSRNKIRRINSSELSPVNYTHASYLRHLNLHQNLIQEINVNSFQTLVSLQELDVSDNVIYAIHVNSFDALEALTVLNLSGNHLDQLKHEWFQGLSNLTVLDLSHNKIQALNNVVFWSLHHLVHLRVDYNRISSVGLLSLKGLDSLRYLNVSHNNIMTIQTGTLRPTPNLDVLDMSYNPITSLHEPFKHGHNIRKLHASHLYNLSHLSKAVFTDLESAEEVFMNNCPALETVQSDAFSPLKAVRKLDLRFNNFTTLPSGLFDQLLQIERVRLNGNPWFCDCRLYWLLLWLRDNVRAHLLSPSNTLCAKPSNLTDVTVLDAVDKHMVCRKATVIEHTTQAHFRLFTSAVLSCRVDGSPAPSITWTTPHKHRFNWTAEYGASVGNSSLNGRVDRGDCPKFVLLQNGDLFVREVQRGDSGHYRCTATNVLGHQMVAIRLTLDYDFLVNVKIVSVLVGCATAFGFVLITMVVMVVSAILRRFGVECPCCMIGESPRARQLYRMLESLEQYRCQQLERLRDNYACQVLRIKENCTQQMEKIRESYTGQTDRLRDFCDYGTAQITNMRDNYYSQHARSCPTIYNLTRVRDPCTCHHAKRERTVSECHSAHWQQVQQNVAFPLWLMVW
ncbi:uncharacterized protein LOC142578846 isoform X2 [Dermacentor variabilis]|uniref:uncharacterized protein LOC142578846 isoform X2 n=1 Tax=Dermacentor variabilis TaxID=34621 RepID=UPI003F5C2E24